MNNSLFSMLSEEHLRDILQTLQAYTQIPIQLIDSDGGLLMDFGREPGFCTLLQSSIRRGSPCLDLRKNAGQRARELGEGYIFSCHANLNHIAFPLMIHDTLAGCVILGPFLMEQPDSTLVSGVAEQYTLSPTRSLELYDELNGMQIVTPPRAQLLKKLLDHLLTPLIPEERALLMHTKEKAFQQSRINETIQHYKGAEQPLSARYFHQKEKELLSTVRTGDVAQVKALLNDLLGFVLFSQGSRLESVRIRAIELTALLSRVAMDGGAREEVIYELNNNLLPALYREQNLDNLCLELQEVAENFMSAMFSQLDKGNLYVRNALRFMDEHYHEHLELAEVAESVHLSPSYFSSLFRQVVGVSFREQLARIRVEKSKQLLLSTDYCLADIAVAVGFPDQSYYCKVFKRIVGLTPGQFRG